MGNSINKIIQRLADDLLSEQQRKKVVLWLLDREDMLAKEQALKQFWDDIPEEADEKAYIALANLHKRMDNQQPIHRVFRISQKLKRYVAVVALPLIGVLCTWLYFSNKGSNFNLEQCYVPSGEQRTVLLDDGTEVVLNADTYFIYPNTFSSENRIVYLCGEAHFSVTKNPKKPFIVKCGVLDVKVLGTTFNINAYIDDDRITTTLETGLVNVSKESDSDKVYVLHPSDQLIYYRKADTFKKNKVDPEVVSGWRKGELYFESNNLEEILRTLERKYDLHINMDYSIKNDEDYYNLRFRHNESLRDVFDVISKLIPGFEYSIGDSTVIKRKR